MDPIAQYVLDLANSVEASNRTIRAAREAREAETRRQWRDRITPMTDRVAAALAGIPQDLMADGLSMRAITQLLRGKYRGHAHPGEVATALRALGWERVRGWSSSDGGFRALWFPPSKGQNHA